MHTFEWDGQDKLRRAVKNGAEVLTATYDGDGLRVGKTDATGMHTYHREPGGTLMEDSNSGGASFVYTPGFAQRSGTENRFFHEDWLGSTRSTTNLQTGAVKGTHQWDAFGQRSATGSGEFQGSSFLWGGGWGYETEDAGRFDKGLGLVLMGQRYYDPELGRFISADPIGLAGGFNQYAYCDNDPVNAVDPDGLRPLTAQDQQRLALLRSRLGTVNVLNGKQFDHAIRGSIKAIQQAIAAVPTGTPDPARLRAAFWAIDHLGDTNYGFDGRVSNGTTGVFGSGFSKCNAFVSDAYAAGAGIGFSGPRGFPVNQSNALANKWPPGATALASPSANVKNFPVVASPSIGDIVSFTSSPQSHTTLYLGGGLLIYAGHDDVKIQTLRYNLQFFGVKTATYRRYLW